MWRHKHYKPPNAGGFRTCSRRLSRSKLKPRSRRQMSNAHRLSRPTFRPWAVHRLWCCIEHHQDPLPAAVTHSCLMANYITAADDHLNHARLLHEGSASGSGLHARLACLHTVSHGCQGRSIRWMIRLCTVRCQGQGASLSPRSIRHCRVNRGVQTRAGQGLS